MNPDIMMIGQSQESLANHGGPVVEEEDRVSAFSGIEGDDDNNLMMPQLQQPDNLSLSQSSAERAVQEALDHHRLASESLSSGDGKDLSSADSCKRTLEDAELDKAKKLRTEEAGEENVGPATDDIGIIPPGSEGIKLVRDADVLSGRGGGTNVHPGNRHFRDLINLHRRAYLKARKNDKPSISRAIVRAIRENNGRFLKRDEKTGLFFEIGDVNAREKAGQALRQRAPEMRKILFESEQSQVRSDAKEQIIRQQHQQMALAGMGSAAPISAVNLAAFHPMLHPSMALNGNIMMAPLFAMNKGAYPIGMPAGVNNTTGFTQMQQNLIAAAMQGQGVNKNLSTPHGSPT